LKASPVDGVPQKTAPIKGFRTKHESARAAYRKVLGAVIVKALPSVSMPDKSYRIAQEVFVLGFRQNVVSQPLGVSRQRVHNVWKKA
jgi:hypothetical protein